MTSPKKTWDQALEVLRIIEESGADRQQAQRVIEGPLSILCKADFSKFSELTLMDFCGLQVTQRAWQRRIHIPDRGDTVLSILQLLGGSRIDHLVVFLERMGQRFASEVELRALAQFGPAAGLKNDDLLFGWGYYITYGVSLVSPYVVAGSLLKLLKRGSYIVVVDKN